MDDRRRALLGDAGRERARGRASIAVQLAGLRLLPLPLPAVQLAGDVVLLAAEVAEPGGVGVDGVDLDQGVDDALADRPPVVLVGKDLGLGEAAQDRPLDELHHVEGRAVDALVLAEPDHRRDRHVGAAPAPRRPCARAPCRGRSRAACRAAAGAAPSCRRPASRDAVGQVRVAAGDPLEAQRQLDAGDVLPEPGFERLAVDPLRSLDGAVGVPVASSAIGAQAYSRRQSTAEPVARQPADGSASRSALPCSPRLAVIGVGRFIQQRQDFEDAIARSYQVEIVARETTRPRHRRPGSRTQVVDEQNQRRTELRDEISGDTRDTALLVAAGLLAGLTGAAAALQRADLLDAATARGAGRRRRATRRRRPSAPGSRSAASRRRPPSAPPSTRWPRSCSSEAESSATSSTG